MSTWLAMTDRPGETVDDPAASRFWEVFCAVAEVRVALVRMVSEGAYAQLHADDRRSLLRACSRLQSTVAGLLCGE